MKTKQCTRCKLFKGVSYFGKFSTGKNGLRSECKACHSLRSHEYYLQNKEHHRVKSKAWASKNKEAVRFYYVRRMYGITRKEWEKILMSQNYRCPLCLTESRDKRFFHTDHDHLSRKVRGLLCRNCNLMLGNCLDNIEILQRAIEYLKFNGK